MAERWASRPDDPRHGRAKGSTIVRDFNRLRAAIQRHDPEATEDAWLNCERWLDYAFARAMAGGADG